jgi:hypothetical protein
MLIFLDKGIDVAGFTTGKTFKDLLGLAHVHGGIGIVVKGAYSPEIGAHPFERNICAYDFYDVVAEADLIY